MKNTLCILLILVFYSCKKDNPILPEQTDLISGETFNETVLIDEHIYDNLIIEKNEI